MTKKNLLLPFFTLIVLISAGQYQKPTNTSDFVMECMKTSGELPDKQMALWFPYNFWQIIGEQMNITSDAVQDIADEMSNYMMFAVVDYHVSNSGVTFKSDEEIRKSIKLYDSSKKVYAPINDKDISPTAKMLLQNFQPVMSQMLGQFGAGMRVFLFDAKKKNGRPIIDIATVNNFTLSWEQISIRWTLPFSSALPPKYCPVDGEQMKGNWNYCPVHGVKLSE